MISSLRRGFTLIEILIVVAILAVLTGVAVSYYGDFTQQATEATVRNNFKVIRGAIENYMKRHMEGPTKFSQLGMLQSVHQMTVYQMPNVTVDLEIEVPDHSIADVSNNVMVASHVTWLTVNHNEGISPGFPQFRNIRLSGTYMRW